MQATFRRLAESVRSGGLNLREVSEALYPPIPCVCEFSFPFKLWCSPYQAIPKVASCTQISAIWDAFSRRRLYQSRLFSRIPTNAVSHVTSEFRRHREATNPVHIMGFLTQWKMYLDELPRSHDAGFFGKKLDPTMFEKASICHLHPVLSRAHLRVIDRCQMNNWGNYTSLCMRRRTCGRPFRKTASHEI